MTLISAIWHKCKHKDSIRISLTRTEEQTICCAIENLQKAPQQQTQLRIKVQQLKKVMPNKLLVVKITPCHTIMSAIFAWGDHWRNCSFWCLGTSFIFIFYKVLSSWIHCPNKLIWVFQCQFGLRSPVYQCLPLTFHLSTFAKCLPIRSHLIVVVVFWMALMR